ncbi:sigma-70 family RNA polymerase sigma factor [Virgibacillus siamensis]|uniref:sigma-70 family RNA polymerase sigma factor n=1 Tax=Virgibacillus siamensis TaxID=480071 RepID=UPI000985F1E7|nr:sigma-70 family RNA polymerase sigma factor [Virgibacillus siamensis]
MESKLAFEEIFEQNKRRIYHQIHNLNINDPQNEFFQEGLIAMWNAYEKYQPDKGPMTTYFNYSIRNRLIDRMRKDKAYYNLIKKVKEYQLIQHTDGNHHNGGGVLKRLAANQVQPLIDPEFWKALKANLTVKQWKWICFYIIEGMSYKEIAAMENTTEDAVKGWGREMRKKLRDAEFRKKIGL